MRRLLLLTVSLAMACSNGSDDRSECVPACDGRECGSDGCGGSCGACDDSLECTNDSCQDGECRHVTQEVFCLINQMCVPSGTIDPNDPCRACYPATSLSGWAPVEDGTACGAQKRCYQGACCDPAANCAGRECGDDGCGGTCGECAQGTCTQDGACFVEVCEPACAGRECGDDGCGGSCGECDGENMGCVDGTCQCVPQCDSAQCGPDGCGGSCGLCEGINVVCEAGTCQCAGGPCGETCCASYQVCTDALTCCDPACEGKQCGEDGCGGLCGTCEGGPHVACIEGTCVCKGTVCPKACCANAQVCDADGFCCDQACEGKQCGDDGCGGACGTCPVGGLCLNGLCPPPGQICNDGNDEPWDGCTQGDLSEFRVNTTTADYQTAPRVAALAGGGFVVAWESKGQDGDGWGVYARRFGADGFPAGPEFRLSTVTQEDQQAPALAALPGGGFVAVWQSWGQDGTGWGVFGQRFNADGTYAGSELAVNEGTFGDQAAPAVAAGDDGFVVVWEGNNPDGDWNGIVARSFALDGTPLTAQYPLNTTTLGEQKAPALAALADGGFVAAWQSAGQDGNGTAVVGRLLDAGGGPAGEEFQLNTYAPLDQTRPRLTARPGGGFAAAWESEDEDTSGLGIVQAVFDAEGELVASPSVAHVELALDQKEPAVAPAGGGVVVAWTSKDQDGSDYGVFGRLFDSDGQALAPEFGLSTFTLSIQSMPDLAPAPDGGFIAVWRSWEQDADGYDIFAARFDADGQLLYH